MNKLVLFWLIWGLAVMIGMLLVDNGIDLILIVVALMLAAVAGVINYSDLKDRYEGRR